MKGLKCAYCGKPIMNNEHYKRVVADDTLEMGTVYFVNIIPRYYHYKCYHKMLKETREQSEK